MVSQAPHTARKSATEKKAGNFRDTTRSRSLKTANELASNPCPSLALNRLAMRASALPASTTWTRSG
eukprot:12572880-Alexandrium_andersonii.AAC.1